MPLPSPGERLAAQTGYIVGLRSFGQSSVDSDVDGLRRWVPPGGYRQHAAGEHRGRGNQCRQGFPRFPAGLSPIELDLYGHKINPEALFFFVHL